MARKPNVSLTVSVTEGSSEESSKSHDVTFSDSGGISNLYNLRDFSYNERNGDPLGSRSTTSQNSPCESDDSTPPLTPTRAERRPLKVDFSDRDVIMEMEGGRAQKRKDIEKDLKKLSRRGTGSLRYTEPRMSLLGKPLAYRMHRKDARIRKIQARIYNFLERPKIWSSVIYHVLMFRSTA